MLAGMDFVNAANKFILSLSPRQLAASGSFSDIECLPCTALVIRSRGEGQDLMFPTV
jgi:hypothetical protein